MTKSEEKKGLIRKFYLSFFSVTVISFVTIFSPAYATYQVIDLGTLGGEGSFAESINNYGNIVGQAEDVFGNYHACLFNSTGDPNNNLDLGTLGGDESGAYFINNRGQIVGWATKSNDDNMKACLFNPTGGLNEILWGDSINSINDLGKMVGYGYGYCLSCPCDDCCILWNFADIHACFYWYYDEFLEDTYNLALGRLDGNINLGGEFSIAYCINNNDQIVGCAENISRNMRACLFGTSEKKCHKIDLDNIDLGTLGGDNSEAYYINSNDQIVGSAENTSSAWHACLFDSTGNGANIDLGTLGGDSSVAYCINDKGKIVGQAVNSSGYSCACLFDSTGNGANIDLNSLIDPSSGWKLIYAKCINDNGWIVGWGSHNGQYHGFLLVPDNLPTLNIITTKMVSPNSLGVDIEVWYPENIPETALKKVKFWATINGVPIEQIFDITRLVEPGEKQIIKFDYNSLSVPPRVIDLERKGVPKFEKHETFKIHGVAFWDNGLSSKEATGDVDILLPVIILHGYTFTHTIWGSFIELIKFSAYAGLMSFLHDYGYTPDNEWYRTMWGPLDCSYQADKETIQSIEQTVDRWVERALEATYANKVDFIGHSTGGLVARYYAGNSSKVNTVITVGTPHLGVADFFNQSFTKETKEAGEMLLFKPGTKDYNLLLWFDPNYPSSSLVRIDESGGYKDVPEPFDNPQYEPYKFHPINNPDVKYYSIFANHNSKTPYKLVVEDRGDDWYRVVDATSLHGKGDGYILDISAGAFFPTYPAIIEGAHAKLCLQNTVQHRILRILTDKENIVSNGASSACYKGVVLPLESVSHSFSITGSPACVQVDLTWPGSCLQLCLQDPNGEIIDSQRAMVDPNIEFVQGNTFEQYVIYFPENGNWQILVTAVDVLAEGEIYNAVVYLTDAKASNPYPIYDARNITTNQILEWISGIKMISHNVYFGSNEADVNSGTNDTFKGNYLEAEFNPGLLAPCNTYYWRIDEVGQSGGISKGNVWKFSTYCPDINRDKRIDIEDLIHIVSEWLNQPFDLHVDMDPPPYGDNWVNFEDFKILSKHWLEGVDFCPDDPNKTQPGTCGCGIPDIDVNGDGIYDCGFRYGDVSSNGEVTAVDAALAAQCANGLVVLTDLQRYAADVDGDSCVTDIDANLIAQYAVGLISSFPIEHINPKPTVTPECNCQNN